LTITSSSDEGERVARRAFKVIDVVEILVHWHAGRRIGEVSSSLGVDPKTVRKYLAPAIEAGLAPGGPPLSGAEWSVLVEGWFPDLVDRTRRQSSWAEIEPHREAIKGWLGAVTVSTIHQRLRDAHGLSASESSLRRFIWANFAEEAAQAAVVVLRDATAPGDEAQCGKPHRASYVDPANMRRRCLARRIGAGEQVVDAAYSQVFEEDKELVGRSVSLFVGGEGSGPGYGFLLEPEVGVEVHAVGGADVLMAEDQGDGCGVDVVV
jgi:hypothetical protein